MTPYTPASPPFQDPDADVIIRSSDNVGFRVYTSFLRVSSPFFRSMLSLPQPSRTAESADDFDGDTPIVQVTEPSTILDLMLRFCYPFGEPKITALSDVVDLIVAMRKYELVQLDRVVELCFDEDTLASEPFEYYTIACRLQLQEQAQKAAFYTLRYPFPTTIPGGSDLCTGAQMYQLLIYRAQCGNVARAQLQTIQWSRSHVWLNCHNSYCPPGDALTPSGQHQRTVRRWFELFLSTAAWLLEKQPWPTVLLGQLTDSSVSNGRNREVDRVSGNLKWSSIACDCTIYAPMQWDELVRTKMVQHFEPALRKVKLGPIA